MRIFLIDTENVGWTGLTGAENLNNTDMIYVLIGNNIKNHSLKAELVIELLKNKVQYVFEETGHSGKNYLDFQLSLIVGKLIERYPDAEIIIISKDHGYNAVIDYLTKHNKKGCTAQSVEAYLNPSVVKVKETKPVKVKSATVKTTTKKRKNRKMVVETEEDLKKYQEEIANIISAVFPDKKKMIVTKQSVAASNKKTKKELKEYCANNLGDIKLRAFARICQLFPY